MQEPKNRGKPSISTASSQPYRDRCPISGSLVDAFMLPCRKIVGSIPAATTFWKNSLLTPLFLIQKFNQSKNQKIGGNRRFRRLPVMSPCVFWFINYLAHHCFFSLKFQDFMADQLSVYIDINVTKHSLQKRLVA